MWKITSSDHKSNSFSLYHRAPDGRSNKQKVTPRFLVFPITIVTHTANTILYPTEICVTSEANTQLNGWRSWIQLVWIAKRRVLFAESLLVLRSTVILVFQFSLLVWLSTVWLCVARRGALSSGDRGWENDERAERKKCSGEMREWESGLLCCSALDEAGGNECNKRERTIVMRQWPFACIVSLRISCSGLFTIEICRDGSN